MYTNSTKWPKNVAWRPRKNNLFHRRPDYYFDSSLVLIIIRTMIPFRLILLGLLFLLFTSIAEAKSYSRYPDQTLSHSLAGMDTNESAYKAYVQYVTNMTTPGFKEMAILNRQVAPADIQSQVYYRFFQGPAIQTREKMDFLVEGRGFFTIRCPWGAGYTKDGRFKIGPDRRLITVAGEYPVLGEHGEIFIPDGEDFAVTNQGAILVGNQVIDVFKITYFKDLSKLESVNGVIFYMSSKMAQANEAEPSFIIRQGYYEGSNVQQGILGDLYIFRNAYDANTKTVKTVLKTYSSGMQIGSVQ